MKKMKASRVLAGLVAVFMLAFAGCAAQNDAETEDTQATDEAAQAETSETGETADEAASFSYSEGIDENGHWEGVVALDYVQLCDYLGVSIPAETHEITDDAVQSQVDSLLSSCETQKQVTDRAVADGDTLNIDYVGSVDGVEFDGGSTQGAGTDVTVGVTSYIDDFIEQLIGHMPGDEFDVEVTFPDPYQNNTDLSGKDAVFHVTINYIEETETPELTDEFVSENLSASYGWTTAQEVTDGIYHDLQTSAVSAYLQDYLLENCTVSSTPDAMIEYQQNSMMDYYNYYAQIYGMELEDFLSAYVGYDSTEALLADYLADCTQAANFYLIIQAVAEDADITLTADDVAAYFSENMGVDDYSDYETAYGMPYLMQVVLCDTVMTYLAHNAVLA